MNFITKTELRTVNNSCFFGGAYQKPSTCPFCGIETDATTLSVSQINYKADSWLYVVAYKCTLCQKRFVGLYEKIKVNGHEKLDYIEVLPRQAGKELPECLAVISPRFIEVHKEAEGAESFGFTDLAAMGYRKALEILVKDFAISELGKTEEEVAAKKLEVAIGLYLQQEELVKTADVVRILGNDHTHYKEKYPDFDFTLLKHYYEIFLKLIVTQYEIKHPPVARRQ